MLKEETYEKLILMRLRGMAAGLEELRDQRDNAKLSFDDRLGLIVDREWNERQDRSLRRRLKIAKLREQACMEDIDFHHPRHLDRSVMHGLMTCNWIRNHENIVITGATGLGKTWISCALANKACREGFSSIYTRVPRLLHQLALARADGSYVKQLIRLAKANLLILDDWGLSALSDEERRDMLEILEDRHGLKSTIVASQMPVSKWHDTIGDPTIADAIMDRLINSAHRIKLKGPSMRKKESEHAD
ncbi:MAG: IS21-like element helper ATPase IstB [Planctomycetota bacterium]|jgi:DNA replication protein DnaC